MGEAKRRKALDPSWGNGKKSRTPDNRETLYQSYLKFCSERGIEPNPKETFVSDLTTICEESGIPIEIDRDNFGEVWVKGLRLRRPGTDDSEPVLEEKFPRLKEFFNLQNTIE